MKYLLGIDFGGGSSKATLLGEDGVVRATATAEYPTLYPALGYCEQRPEDWIKALVANCRSILACGVNPSDIVAVAVDSATHTAVLCDELCNPLRPAIHWTDSRSRAEAAELRERYGDRIFARTFHKPDTIWTLPQILWVARHEPELFSKVRRVFFEKDYIRWCLTGEYVTDRIEAQGSMFFDCVEMKWSDELCATIGLDASILPPVVDPKAFIGTVRSSAVALTGLALGTPVICGTTDTVLEVLASGAVNKGDTTVKLATAGRICVITDRPCPDRDVVNYSHLVDGLWYPGSATKAAASSLRWYRDTFGGDYRAIDAGAASVPLGAEGLMFHPYINGELTPYADPLLSGSFIGVRATHTKGHFDRAVLEGIAFSLLASKKKLLSLGVTPASCATLIGGGAKSPLWQSILADTLGIRLRVTENSDSSLGAAMLAGVAAGVFKDEKEAVARVIREVGCVDPNPENTARYAEIFEEYEAVHDALAPIYHARSGV